MTVRNALLGLLAQRPRHGYELRAAFEALVGGEQAWDVKPAQVYTTLARLEESGLVVEKAVEQDGGPEKRIYDITAAGRGELNTWLETGLSSEHQRDEFYVKLMLSLMLDDGNPYRVIQVQRARLYQDLHDITEQRSQISAPADLSRLLLLDKAVMHLEADLRWLDIVEARLDDMRRHPPPEPEIRPRGRPKKA